MLSISTTIQPARDRFLKDLLLKFRLVTRRPKTRRKNWHRARSPERRQQTDYKQAKLVTNLWLPELWGITNGLKVQVQRHLFSPKEVLTFSCLEMVWNRFPGPQSRDILGLLWWDAVLCEELHKNTVSPECLHSFESSRSFVGTLKYLFEDVIQASLNKWGPRLTTFYQNSLSLPSLHIYVYIPGLIWGPPAIRVLVPSIISGSHTMADLISRLSLKSAYDLHEWKTSCHKRT